MTSNSTLNLVLDLDNTMIHTFVPEYSKDCESYIKVFEKEKNFLTTVTKQSFIGFVFLRPYLIDFLLKAQKVFKLYVFSAGTRDYVYLIINTIISKYPQIQIDGLFSNEYLINNKKCILRYLDVQKTYIIDDLPSYWNQKCFRINQFISFKEEIKIDEKTNKKSILLDKKYNDNDKYLLDYFDKFIQIVNLDINL